MPRLFMHQHLVNHVNNAVPPLFFIIAAIVRFFILKNLQNAALPVFMANLSLKLNQR